MGKFSFNTFSELYQACISRLDPARPILIYKDNEVTTAEFINTVKMYTLCLHEIGIIKGSRVVLSLADCPEVLYIVIALSQLGACAIPMHHVIPTQHKLSIIGMFNAEIFISEINNLSDLKNELRTIESRCTIVTLDKNEESDYSLYEMIAGLKNRQSPKITTHENDTLFIISSSGTSGIPKFVEITQRNVVNVVKATAYFMKPKDDFMDGYKILCAFPLSTSAILTLLAQFFLGITVIILDDFSPIRFLSLIEQWEVDIIAATPAYYETLINLPVIYNYKTGSVKRIYSGMDFLSNKLLHKIKNYFQKTKIAGIGYGLTETCSVVMAWQAYKEKDFYVPTNCMTLIPGIDNEIEIINTYGEMAEIGEQGEIIISGQNVVKEYYRNPGDTGKAFRKGGWFYTGDLGCKDEEGRILILGRIKDVIKRGGRSISPVVINNHILKHHGVTTSAVVGVPHTRYGEMIWAFIQKGKDQNITKGTLMKHCREGLPPYMIPDHITFIDKIPAKPGIGKIDKNELMNIALKELKNMSGGINEK